MRKEQLSNLEDETYFWLPKYREVFKQPNCLDQIEKAGVLELAYEWGGGKEQEF